MKYAEGKVRVARCSGDSNSPDRLRWAGDSIKDAIREWNAAWNWAFKVFTMTSVPLAANTCELTIPNIRRVYNILPEGTNQGALRYVTQQLADQSDPLAGESSFVDRYTLITAPTGHTIHFYGTPTSDTLLTIKGYYRIAEPLDDADELDVPDEYVNALLDMARYLYLRDRADESPRTNQYKRDAEMGLRRCMRDDRRHPNHWERFIGVKEHSGGGAYLWESLF